MLSVESAVSNCYNTIARVQKTNSLYDLQKNRDEDNIVYAMTSSI